MFNLLRFHLKLLIDSLDRQLLYTSLKNMYVTLHFYVIGVNWETTQECLAAPSDMKSLLFNEVK